MCRTTAFIALFVLLGGAAGSAAAQQAPRPPAPDPIGIRDPSFGSYVFLGWSVFAILVFGVCVLVGRRADQGATGSIRITRPPASEAPSGIRAAWVGLVLPLAPGFPVPVTAMAYGAVTQDSEGKHTGFLVDGQVAVRELGRRNRVAAAWWGEHAPHVLEPGYRFLFATEVCERVV